MPRSYTTRDIKRLFALSYNRCAATNCTNPIVVDATDVDDAEVVGHIAHIVASSSQGPRGDPDYPADKLDDELNLILLCGRHHAVVDRQPSTYTVADLRRWKEEHRRRYGSAAVVAAHDVTIHPPTPFQVPAAPAAFVNRREDLDALDRLTSDPDPGGAAVVVLTGAHGVGKTGLTRYWAHRNRERFADGQLHVDFGDLRHRGAVAVADVLGDLLTAFEVPEQLIPTGLAQRAALFRSHTQGRQLLVVLDDAEHEAEVIPLLPSAPESVVLIAGRAALRALRALLQDRGRRLRLRRLDDTSAAELLERMIGPDRVGAEPEAVSKLVEFCSGLPVALRVCAARLLENDRKPVSWLVELLEDEHDRLAELSALDAVFNDAYRALSGDERRLYRRLAEHPGRSFSEERAAAVSGMRLATVRRLLERLVAAQLVEDEGDRYRFHDLLRLHARDRAQRDESRAERDAAALGVVRFYVNATRAVDLAVTRERLRVVPPPEDDASIAVEFRDDREALAWFEAERPNILAVLRMATMRELDLDICRICEALWACYFNKKPYAEWIEAHELAVAAARRLGNPAAEARLRSALAKALTETGEHTRAEDELVAARRMAERAGHPVLQASVLDFRGHLELDRRRYRAAEAAFERARDMHAAAGVLRGVVLGDFHVGRALAGRGEYRQAVNAYRAAIAGIDRAQDEPLLGRTLIALADASLHLGEPDAARAAAEEALEIMRSRSLRCYEARALEVLAMVSTDDGELDCAAQLWQQAHALYQALSSPRAHDLAARVSAADPDPEG